LIVLTIADTGLSVDIAHHHLNNNIMDIQVEHNHPNRRAGAIICPAGSHWRAGDYLYE